MPNLPSTDYAVEGFDIPDIVGLGLVPTPPPGVGSFPATTAGFDIPDMSGLGLLPTPPASEPDLPSNVLAFAVPGGATPGGIAYDGSASFYIVTKGTGGSSNDQIVKVDSSGVVDGAWGTGGYVDAPSNNIDGIAYLDSMLWVLENQWRCFETVDPTNCDRAHRVFEMDPTSVPASDSDWGALSKIYAPDQWDEMGGITAKGSGSTGTLWLANKWGFRLYNINQSGAEIESFFTDQFVDGMDGVAYSTGPTTSAPDDFLMTSRNAVMSQWSTSASKRQDFTTSLSNVKGMTFISSVLYMASSDGNVYKAFVGVNVTTDPRGITYSPSTASVGEAIWILVDGSPFDKILKVNPDTGLLISSFGTNGAVDAPSNKTEGITFLGSSLYVIANESFDRYIYTINATSGAVSATMNLANVNVWDDLAGITNDGTNVIVHTKSFWNGLFVLDPSNSFERTGTDGFPCCPSFNGAKGLAYHSGRDSYYAANGGTVGVYTGNFELDTEVGLTESATPLTGIQGLAFNGDLMFVAHDNSGGKISKTFLATNITTKPRGMGFSSSSSTPGEALWILVDGSPLDKLMKVNPSTGLLISSFDTDGVIDAPSSKTEGITYLDTGDPTTSFLWIIANENSGRKLYKLNATTGATVSTFDVSNTADVWDDIGGITNDGTNLVLYAKTFTSVWTIDPSDASKIEQSWPCCANAFGAKALAYHTGRGQVFAAKSSSLLRLDSSLFQIELEQNLLIDGSPAAGVEGMVFSQDVLYVARNDGGTGKVSLGALRTTVTNQATAMAYTPTGTSINGILVDRALWILVDGSPFDQLLKVDPDAGTLMTDFSTDGAIETPSGKTAGLTYLNSSLWIGANDTDGTKLYKINPASGALLQTFTLNNCPNPCSFFDNMGGLTNDGTNLIVFRKNDTGAVYLDPLDGTNVEDKWGGGASINGGQSIAYMSARQQLFVGKNDRVVQYVVDGSNLFMADEYTTSLSDIRGMTFIDNDVLYIAHDSSGKVVKTAIPSDVSNNPRGLAYDSGADELYILVDGKAEDHVIVVDRVSGAQIRDFPVNDQQSTNAITFLNGSLYVAVEGEGVCCGPPPRFILELNSTTGAVINQLNTDDLPGRVFGLDNNGTNLIAAPEHGGPHVEILDPSGGFRIDDIFFFDPSSPFFEEGFEGLAYRASAEEYFPIKGNTVWRFNKSGRLIQEIDVTTAGFANVKGAVFAGSQLYLAERNGNTIHATGLPVPPTVITSNPKGMATDGTNLYLVIDAEPRDKIMKVDTDGNLDGSFGSGGVTDLPGTEVGDIAFHGGSLFVVTNDERTIPDQFGGGFTVETFPVIHEIDPNTAVELNRNKIHVQDQFGPPWQLFAPIGALTSDGTDLYLGATGDTGMQGTWFKWNPSGGPVEQIFEFAGPLPFMQGFQAFTVLPDSQFPPDRQLVASGPTFGPDADTIVRFDRDSGAMFRETTQGATAGQFHLTGTDIKGMAYIGRTLYAADDQTDKVYGTSLPENTIELTIVGAYDASLSVEVSPDVGDPGTVNPHQGSPASFSIDRNPNVVAQFTTVETVSGVEPLLEGFVLTDTATILTGRLNDPSIDEIEVGIRLPSTVLIDDHAVQGQSEALWVINSVSGGPAVWHIACEGDAFPSRVTSSPCSWRYAKPNLPTYSTGGPTDGTLTTANSVEVNPGTRLEFFTGYATELSPDCDLKLVEIAPVTTDVQGNEQVGVFEAVAQIVRKGGGDAFPPPGAHGSFNFIELDPLFINPSMSRVEMELSAFAGQRVMIRFTFDSIDAFANDGEGWYLDDIKVTGSGFKTIIVPTTLLVTPIMDGGQAFYRTFSTPFELAEGQNEVGFIGRQPYSPFNDGFTLITGFVDQTAPQVTLFGVPGATSNLVQTLQGTVLDATFQSLDVTQKNPDGSTVVVFSTGSLPEDGSFSVPVSLLEGANTFTAVATDGGNLNATSTPLVVVGDITPPAASMKVVTVTSAGEATTGDQFFVIVAASDSLSGVSSVIDLASGNPMVPISEVPQILVKMHGLDNVAPGTPTTHVMFSDVQPGTPVGVNTVNVKIIDNANNESTANGTLNVVSARSNRNYFLFPGVNFMGLGLIPDDGDSGTTDDASLDRLMTQDVTSSVNPVLAAALGGTVTLGDVIESTFAFNNAGNFIVHTPGSGAADTLTDLEPFQGMNVKTLEITSPTSTPYAVFHKVDVEGFTAQQAVPIRVNIEGVFFTAGELPPNKVLRVGYNLIAPHILADTLFDTVYRGALIPNQLAVSAITFQRRVDSVIDGSAIQAEILEGFVTNSLGDMLQAQLSYWTFVVQDDPTNPTTPTITP